MKIKKALTKGIRFIANQLGYALVSKAATTDNEFVTEQVAIEDLLPTDSSAYLRPDNPRLAELQQLYKQADEIVTTAAVWKEGIIKTEDIQFFRGQNAYVFQRRAGAEEANYALTYYYLRKTGQLDLLERLTEDHYFGIHTFNIDSKVVSRDLLDSVSEISFLEEELNLSSLPDFTVLDIGSGYGRMAHRITSTFENINQYLCTDAIPVSSFICEHYLNFRNINNTASILPLNEIDVLANKKVDLALNIHSFSECTIPAIKWWCNHLAEYGVRYLMIVPNSGAHGGEQLKTTPGNEDFQKVIEEAGYQLVTKRPKYKDPAVQRNGIFPTYYYLFSLSK